MRIEAGLYKGRKILPPPGGSGTRPMTGFVKKSLFGTLLDWVEGALVLDLYSGTGTMGIEALSRGARKVCFAEHNRSVIERLRRNLRDIGRGDDCVIWAGNIEASLAGWLTGLGEKVDLAFVDPPFSRARKWDWDSVGQRVFQPLSEHLLPDGRTVLRLPKKTGAPDHLGGLDVVKVKEYGGMDVRIYTHPVQEE